MPIWIAALWGLTGGLCLEGIELYGQINKTPKWSWRLPIPQGLAAWIIRVVIRTGVGAAIAAAMTASGQLSGPAAAFGLGVAGFFAVERLAKVVPIASAVPGGVSGELDILTPPQEAASLQSVVGTSEVTDAI